MRGINLPWKCTHR